MSMKLQALIIGLVILVADQLSKLAALKYFAEAPVEVLPFLNFVLVWNRGVSFGIFSNAHDYGPYILAALSLAVVVGLAFWMRSVSYKPLFIALACVIAGAFGNVIDRLVHGAVVDFLDFHIGAWHYPAFNIADSAIVLGIAFVIVDSIFLEPKRNKAETKDA